MRKRILCAAAGALWGIASIGAFAQSGNSLKVSDNQYMRVAHHEDFNVKVDQDFTMSLWLKYDDVIAASNRRLIAKRDVGVTAAGNDRSGYEFFGGNAESAAGWVALNVPLSTSKNVLSAWSTSGGKVGEWFHLALIVDRAANKITFYHNGVSVASAAVGTWTCLNTHDLLVGCGLNKEKTDYFLNGAIDNVRFYRKALTPSELDTEMKTNNISDLAADIKSALRAAYDFEEVSNLSIPDISGNNHIGSVEYVVPPGEGEMKILSNTMTQETALTGRGNENEVILKGKFLITGSIPSSYKSAVIDLSGTTDIEDIESIKIYSSLDVDNFDERKPSATLLGTVTDFSSGKVEIPLSGEVQLGYHYLWITAHIADNAKEGNRVDIQWDKLTLASGEYSLTNPNPDGDREIILAKKLVYAPGDYKSSFYRIPAIIQAADGSLVIATDKRKRSQADLPKDIDVVINRSTDGGKTWSEPLTIAEGKGEGKGFGDAALVKCLNGDLVAVYVGGTGMFNSTPSVPIRTYISKSYDNGITWSEKVDITAQLFGSQCSDPVRQKWTGSFCASGAGLCTSKGRIMFVGAVRHDSGRVLYNHVYYSDDNGYTWSVSESAKTGGDEAKLVELNDGTILMSIRRQGGGGRYYNLSNDQGETWGTGDLFFPDLIEPNCNGDILRFSSTKTGADRDRILHTIPNDAKVRQNVSIFVSYDEAKTWPERKTLCPTLSVYSAIAVLPDETIGVYFEEGDKAIKMYYMNFSLNWLTDGRDPHTGVKTFNVNMDYKAEEGKVTGAGLFAINKTVTLSATPNEGFKFDKWVNNEGQVVSTMNPYKFELTENKDLKALFSPVSSAIVTPEGSIISVSPNPFFDTIVVDGVEAGDGITVYNMVGNVVGKFISTSDKVSLNLSSTLVPGKYIVQIAQANAVHSIPVLKTVNN